MMDAKLAGLKLLSESLEVFGAHCLKIADKGGRLIPFEMNRAQRYLHQRLEKQIKETGKVRAIVLKGRQQGVSTYSAARFYHRTTMGFGKRTLIVRYGQADAQREPAADLHSELQCDRVGV